MPKNEISDVLHGEGAEALIVGSDEGLESDDEVDLALDEIGEDDVADSTDVKDAAVDAAAVEVPSGARPVVDDDEEEEDELEADLNEILRERLASEEEESDEDDDARPAGLAAKSGAAIQEEEITCNGCFLYIRVSQFDMRSGHAACPHCGTAIQT